MRGEKDDRPRPGRLCVAIKRRLDRPFLDDDDLFLQMKSRVAARLAGIQGRDVTIQFVEGCGRSVK